MGRGSPMVTPVRAVDRVLARGSALCSLPASHFSLSGPLSTPVNKFVLANSMLWSNPVMK